jgi:hypothetical protein
MLRRMIFFSLPVFVAGVLLMPVDAMSDATDPDAAHLKAGHKKVEGVVTDIKSGIYTVKTQSGAYTLSKTRLFVTVMALRKSATT